LTPNPGNPITAAEVSVLAKNVRTLTGEVADLPERLEKLEKREKSNAFWIRIAGLFLAFLALAFATAAWWVATEHADRIAADITQAQQAARVSRANCLEGNKFRVADLKYRAAIAVQFIGIEQKLGVVRPGAQAAQAEKARILAPIYAVDVPVDCAQQAGVPDRT
jgi:hypothetical protein